MNKSGNMSSSKKVIIKPIIISNINNRNMVLAPQRIAPSLFLSNLKVAKGPIFQEDVIYESSNCDFLKGESQQVLIVNKVNITTKTCRTIAKCTAKGVCVETTSDDVCALIGQNNYDTVLSALGSLFNQETKVRGILALLKKQTNYRTTATQTDNNYNIKKHCVDTSCQTLESNIEVAGKLKQRKRIRRQQFTPYVVKEDKEVKKCVINIENICKKEDVKKENNDEQTEILSELPDTKPYVDEDSNFSYGSIGNLSSISSTYMPDFLVQSNLEANTHSSINKVTYPFVKLYDGSTIMVPVKPEDDFHIATKEILKNVTREERIKLMYHQTLIDFKMCLEQNEDGYYPLHIAVLQNDVDLVRRQCRALRARRDSVDKPAGDMTALQMSIRNNSSVECTRELLRRGADPLLGDAGRRSALHHAAAAAAGPAHLAALLEHCDTQPRQVLQNNQDFWKPEFEDMADRDLAKYLYEKIGELFDDQGNTPLMLAAAAGRAGAVGPLAARAPSRVDAASPACGATALYRAVAAACLHAKENGNRTSVPDHFLQTAEVLVGHGADPTVENQSGSSVNSLLQEYNIPPLSMVIANKMSAMKHGKLASNMILVKDREGRIVPEQLHKRKTQDMATKSKNVFEMTKELKAKILNFGVEIKRKQEKPSDSSIKEAKCFKTSTVNDTSILKIQTDKMKSAKVIPNQKCSNETAKLSGNKSKIVIVENVSVTTDFSKINIPTANTVVSKPKDIVLVTTKKDHQILRSPDLQKSPKYVKIAPKPVSVRQDEISAVGKTSRT